MASPPARLSYSGLTCWGPPGKGVLGHPLPPLPPPAWCQVFIGSLSGQVLKGHDDHVITCLQFCGNRIVSGSDDNTLKVWSAVTGEVSLDPVSAPSRGA